VGALFLSASVPIVGRGDYYKTADVMLIQAAVRALVIVALGRRLIVWGGHPAITPMIWISAEDLGVPYADWVHLFQSRFFKEMFPEENKRFNNITYVDAVGNDRGASLTAMRTEMFKQHKFDAAVFIGGMDGLFEELDLFKKMHPNALVIPVASTGGAALEISQKQQGTIVASAESIDYIGLFHNALKIAPDEPRGPPVQIGH